MADYTKSKLLKIHPPYVATECIARAAQLLYAQRYSIRRTPSHKLLGHLPITAVTFVKTQTLHLVNRGSAVMVRCDIGLLNHRICQALSTSSGDILSHLGMTFR
ncbi:hypothetical protein NPIL_555211 [Nephila pilipes]|uniref:Uncharacterized protein n=1 Tax=Nephila pilipes TaxID=299642 RepID=A0A8X6P997_NEPPI|nr:hypothetical protein NPIL_555211 [Nephila pilipes]